MPFYNSGKCCLATVVILPVLLEFYLDRSGVFTFHPSPDPVLMGVP